MKNLFKILPFLFLITLFGCGEDEPVPADMVGVYRGTIKSTSVGYGNSSETMDFTLTKISDTRFKLMGDDNLEITIVGVTTAQNGLAFDMESINGTDGQGDQYVIEGVDNIDTNSDRYHGWYVSEEKKLEIKFKLKYNDRQYADYDVSYELSIFKI